jgi:hypothetical protein
MSNFTVGDTICYKCGSPLFVVIKDPGGKSKVTVTWFFTPQGTDETFKVDRNAIETIESFNRRRIEHEKQKNNDRLYRIPPGIDPTTMITLGFPTREIRDRFVERFLFDEFQAKILADETNIKMN